MFVQRRTEAHRCSLVRSGPLGHSGRSVGRSMVAVSASCELACAFKRAQVCVCVHAYKCGTDCVRA